jgi:hypothetical protein
MSVVQVVPITEDIPEQTRVLPINSGPPSDAITPMDGWVEVVDHAEGLYYWHTKTNETTYDRPEGLIGSSALDAQGGGEEETTMATAVWEHTQQARMDEVLEQNKEAHEKEDKEKERRGSVIWTEMVGLRKSVGLRRQSVTDMYLKLKKRFVANEGKKLLEIEKDDETVDDKIEFYLTGETASRKRKLLANKNTRAMQVDEAEKAEKARKERVRMQKEQEEAAIKAAHELEQIKLKVSAEMVKAAKLREMNQEDGAPVADAWPPEDKMLIWVQPEVKKAKDARKAALYQFGIASFMTTNETLGRDMGPGILLYFNLLAMLFFYFLLASVLAIPSMMINMEGRGMDVSASSSYLAILSPTMLGNQGVVCEPPDLLESGFQKTLSPGCVVCLEHPDLYGCGDIVQKACTGLNPHNLCLPYANYTNVTAGTHSAPLTNQTKVMVPFMGKVESSSAALVIMLCDVIATLIFLKVVGAFGAHIDKAIAADDESKISAADYSVWVTGLPLNTTEEALHKHFNERYGCDDWEYYPNHFGCCGSPQLYQGLEPLGRYKNVPARLQPRVVTNTTHLADPDGRRAKLYKGSWIAEITIVHPLFKLISVYQENNSVVQETKEAQRRVSCSYCISCCCFPSHHQSSDVVSASTSPLTVLVVQVKKYQVGSQWSEYAVAFQSGKLRGRERDAQGVLSKLKAQAPKFERKVAEMAAIFDEPPRVVKSDEEFVEDLKEKTQQEKDKEAEDGLKKEADERAAILKTGGNPMDICVGAFITFNNEESAAVCLANYKSSGTWLGRKFQPHGLRFRDKTTGKYFPLKIERAREPGDIRWENLEYDHVKKNVREVAKRRSKILTGFLLLLSFVFLLGVSKVEDKVPLILASFILTTVNNRLEDLMYQCTDTEHHSSNSTYTTSIGMKIFVGCFISKCSRTYCVSRPLLH